MRNSLFVRFFCLSLAASWICTPALSQSELSADHFKDGSGRVWFSDCAFEADRYVTCKSAAPAVLATVSAPGDVTAGEALQMYISDAFIEKGCAFEAKPETFRVNGVFLSFDSNAAKDIRCAGKKSALVFAPGVISFLDTLYFLSEGPPQ